LSRGGFWQIWSKKKKERIRRLSIVHFLVTLIKNKHTQIL
jgi:hypothetical protein